MEFSGKQTLSKSERYLPKKPSSCPPKCYELSVLLFLPPGFWKWNLAGKFASFDHVCTTAPLRSLIAFRCAGNWMMHARKSTFNSSQLEYTCRCTGGCGTGLDLSDWVRICVSANNFEIPYFFNQMPRLLFISLLVLCGYYSRVATIQGQHLFLWKARRHQRRLDKIIQVRRWRLLDAVSSTRSLSVLLSAVGTTHTA